MKHQNQTEWVVHCNPVGIPSNVADFTEARLQRLISDGDSSAHLKEIAVLYALGSIAVAWKRGRPVWVNVKEP